MGEWKKGREERTHPLKKKKKKIKKLKSLFPPSSSFKNGILFNLYAPEPWPVHKEILMNREFNNKKKRKKIWKTVKKKKKN